jgi:hypothetical protein
MTETKAPTLTEFLLARIAEDEAVARGSQGAGWATGSVRMVSQPAGTEHWTPAAPGWVLVEPNHVLAECEAKRRVVERCAPDDRTAAQLVAVASLASDVLRLLALPYADHPDYQQEWKP